MFTNEEVNVDRIVHTGNRSRDIASVDQTFKVIKPGFLTRIRLIFTNLGNVKYDFGATTTLKIFDLNKNQVSTGVITKNSNSYTIMDPVFQVKQGDIYTMSIGNSAIAKESSNYLYYCDSNVFGFGSHHTISFSIHISQLVQEQYHYLTKGADSAAGNTAATGQSMIDIDQIVDNGTISETPNFIEQEFDINKSGYLTHIRLRFEDYSNAFGTTTTLQIYDDESNPQSIGRITKNSDVLAYIEPALEVKATKKYMMRIENSSGIIYATNSQYKYSTSGYHNFGESTVLSFSTHISQSTYG